MNDASDQPPISPRRRVDREHGPEFGVLEQAERQAQLDQVNSPFRRSLSARSTAARWKAMLAVPTACQSARSSAAPAASTATLLELPDQNAVIKVQWPTALALLVVHVVLLNVLMFR